MSLKIDNLKLPRDNFTIEMSVEIDDEVTGVFGCSGAGKTSFIHLLAGLERPQSGRIIFNERELVNVEKRIFLPPYKRRIGLVFQEARLFPHMSVKKNLLFSQKYIPKGISVPDFYDIVKLLEINHLLDSQPSNISGGEAQRVALARTLLSSPELLLLDEPFSAVDVALRKNILPFLWRIREQLQIPMLVISHDMPDILKLTDKLLLINQGKIIGHGAVSQLILEKTASDSIKSSGIVTVFDMKVAAHDGHDTILLSPLDPSQKQELFASYVPDFSENQKVKVCIAPEDIIVSQQPVPETSARNMIQGKVINAIENPGSSICHIDIGLDKPLLAEITCESFKRLDLKPKASVYCLIKANAINLQKAS